MNDRELCHKVRISFVPDKETLKDFNTYTTKYAINRSELLRMALRAFLDGKMVQRVGQKDLELVKDEKCKGKMGSGWVS